MDYRIGMIITGKVTGIQPYGVFVELDKNRQGLIHISEIQHGFTKDIGKMLKVGDTVKVQIIDIEEFTKKISLSLRSLEKNYPSGGQRRKHYFTNRKNHIGFESLERMMPIWVAEEKKRLKKMKEKG
ncbi:CvfD/Ygs/GSP13 family RNA-binding post-transcriptional regulator [Enterococcus hirae]|jgi:general stress protein 13|nr:CvfD/Ygs/GSP13 family RNA-binding post-transcriptional regulator [Enterococcaceae bacterium]MCI1919988.1 CvfD/Ygs/GSP13 family RNA-binding post-transcriptional regulator [Enterococcaceae bacterium]MDM8214379.1 CvfD/Ygs/GSP13 family RNA-binding post-transcriptional regulator [Enterococcus hirae]